MSWGKMSFIWRASQPAERGAVSGRSLIVLRGERRGRDCHVIVSPGTLRPAPPPPSPRLNLWIGFQRTRRRPGGAGTRPGGPGGWPLTVGRNATSQARIDLRARACVESPSAARFIEMTCIRTHSQQRRRRRRQPFH